MANQTPEFLTPPWLDKLCRHYSLDRQSVVVRTNGAHRDVILSPDRVFIFPRKPEYAQSMRHELDFLQAVQISALPMPASLGISQCPELFAGDIGALSLLPGENWEDIQESFTGEFILAALDELADLLAELHESTDIARSFFKPDAINLPFSETPRLQNWLANSLNPQTSKQTVENLHAEMIEAARASGVSTRPIDDPSILATWKSCVTQLANLPPALIHADIHEGQILLQPGPGKKITGILDWEAVQLGNPLIDFSFHKWGWGKVWTLREHFPQRRRQMWARYLHRRNINTISPDSLHLYCSLTDMLRTLVERDAARRPVSTIHRKPYPAAIEEQMETLKLATEHVRNNN